MDLTFSTDFGRFNLRVGAVILHEGKTLLMRNPRAPYLYSVGGRVQYGETTEEAVLREVQEEIGVALAVERPLFMQEAFYDDTYSGAHFHELCLYYLMKDAPLLENLCCQSRTELGDAESLVWVPLEELDRYEVLPASLVGEIQHLSPHLKLIVERETPCE